MKLIFQLTKHLSIFLQKENCDLSRCVEYAENLKIEIQQMRSDADLEFKNLFALAKTAADKIGVNLVPPLRIGMQRNRSNYEGDPETYFRRSIYVPFLDYFIDQLNSRFFNHRELLSKIQNILPSKCTDLDSEAVHKTVEIMEEQWTTDFVGTKEEFVVEFVMWRRHYLNTPKEKKPSNFIDCDRNLYPTMWKLIQIGATLPISVATSERSFSSLRRLKTYLRNKTGEDRLNGLALLNIHRDIDVTHDEILNIISKSKSRRLHIIL
ncbi:hypothetical protein RN001_002400 [Aquatica leii]|uniref:HAT C-terminal dimerisation domain-containing protein n=1 Tax=Aquatica leii TaxID=1421715 RepID=A0AAN7Q581_9COLE|nr:hypothetical protein RN001_002400 [Aquatica leii]